MDEGRLSIHVVRVPAISILEMRLPVTLPLYGPTGGITWAHLTEELVPPIPPSATYKYPSGPNFKPRGLLNPVAKTLVVVLS